MARRQPARKAQGNRFPRITSIWQSPLRSITGKLLDFIGEESRADNHIGHGIPLQQAQRIVQERTPRHGQERLGQTFAQNTHARPPPAGDDDSLQVHAGWLSIRLTAIRTEASESRGALQPSELNLLVS